jgi:hypothetical protein
MPPPEHQQQRRPHEEVVEHFTRRAGEKAKRHNISEPRTAVAAGDAMLVPPAPERPALLNILDY